MQFTHYMKNSKVLGRYATYTLPLPIYKEYPISQIKMLLNEIEQRQSEVRIFGPHFFKYPAPKNRKSYLVF